MEFKVKEQSLGKVRLEKDGVSVILDNNTTQEVLSECYKTLAGKQHIEITKKTEK